MSRESSTSESAAIVNVAQALCEDEQISSTPENRNLPQAEGVVAPITSQPDASASGTQEKATPRLGPSPSPGPPAKRQKVCSIRSKHWEVPRTITVQVQDTEFQLNTSRLERLSGWFKDTLSEEYDSQIIDLDVTRVSAHDFEVLLDSLDKFPTFDMKSPSFDEIVAIIRAATALRFEAEAAWALRRVQEMWPCQLADINLTQRPHAIETIIIARQCNLNAVIKPAFYELIRSAMTSEAMMEDVSNGNLQLKDVLAIESARVKLSARWVALAGSHDSSNRFPQCEDIKKVPFEGPPPLQRIVGSGSVAQRIRKFENGGTDEITTLRRPREQGTVVTCISGDPDRLRQAHTKLVHDSGMLQRYLSDPVCGLQALADALWAKEGLCATCVQARKAVWRTEKERLWAEMDEWF
ncbi:hypothetical protein C0995_002509 [Termitomyces sp. Mi166|nr:hypothetical protein C0995_002509 [Termitomyces sp. Mi166\